MKVDVNKRQSNSREGLFTFYLHTDSLHRPTRRSHRRSPHSNNAGLVQHSWDSNDYRKDTKRWHDYRTGTGSRKGGSHDANGSGRANTGNRCGHTDYKSKTMWESHADSESIAKPYTCSNGQARDESFTSSNWWGKYSHGFNTTITPNSDHVMIHLGGYNCSVCIYSHAISLCGKLILLNCNLPNASLPGLNSVATGPFIPFD